MTDMNGKKNRHGDDLLRETLRSIDPTPLLSQEEAAALRQKVTARAELPLARRRRIAYPVARRENVWTRRLVPLAAAASLAFGFWFGEATAPPAGEGIAIQDIRARLADPDEEILQSNVTEQEFRLLVSGRADPDELLLIAIGEI